MAYEDEDKQEATDLVMDRYKVAMRVIDAAHLEQYGHEFTVRTTWHGEHKSEWEKILKGCVDYMAFCFADEHGLKQACLLDMRALQRYAMDYARSHGGKHPGRTVKGKDYSFLAFEIAQVPDVLVFKKVY